MNIEIKISKKPIEYNKAIKYLEARLDKIKEGKAKELIWILEHNDIYTAGSSYKDDEILDKKIKLIKTNRGGKITWHGPGQIIFYFLIDLTKRNKDIRNFLTVIESSIIKSLKEYNISTFSDRKNIGIWIKKRNSTKKIAAIGIRVKKWIAYHGFSLNINNDIEKYKKIIPCGIKNKGVTNLRLVKDLNYKYLKKKIVKNLLKNL
ncbi:MAG: lipoyl(octanoyl) transferase LipB [Candidatus Pelagibacter sp.]|jgi:lipoyl(octanoyl) transferase|tara:strand:- start:1455 stop:2069 length:615 start_codon:yes stop_codon:yes gene_type:complete